MTDRLNQFMLDSYLKGEDGKTRDPKAEIRFNRVHGVLGKMRTGYFPVSFVDTPLKKLGTQELEFIETPALRKFTAIWRAVRGLPEHTPIEMLMEHAILTKIRTSRLDVLDYVARNLTTPEAWTTGEQHYRDGYINLARNLVHGALERSQQ